MTDVRANIISRETPYDELTTPVLEHVYQPKRFDLGALALGGLEIQAPLDILHELRANWLNLERINPDFFVGATVFGSTVKGRMHPKSDVDTCIFVNPGALRGLKLSEADNEIIHTLMGGKESGNSLNVPGVENIELAFPIIIELNQSAIAEETERLCKNDEGVWNDFLSLTSPGIAMFFLDLGSYPDKQQATLQDMRRLYLEELEKHGEMGAYVFHKLMDILKKNEEYRRQADIYLPATIDRAKKYWRL